MRAVLTNFGTEGDIQPFLALAVELQRYEHEVVMAFSPCFASRIERMGIDFVPIGPDLSEIQNQVNVVMRDKADSVEELRASFAPLVSTLPQVYEELCEACRDADVLISGPAQPAARMIHEITGIPFVSIQVSHFGGIGSPALQQASADLINPFRASLGLPALRNPLTIDANSPQLALYAMSRHVRPPQQDWPAHFHQVGFFFLDGKEGRDDPVLNDFLNGSDPVVVFSFGSMMHGSATTMVELLYKTIERTGIKAVIQKSRGTWEARPLTPNVCVVGYVAHDWLFPRAGCVVQHGGAGTAGAVFRAGVPSVYVPHGHIFDQHYWAQLSQEAGCSGPSIPFAQLTSAKLAKAITDTLSTPDFERCAKVLSEKISKEQGVKRARCLIEKLVQEKGSTKPQAIFSSRQLLSTEELERKSKTRIQLIQRQRFRRGRALLP